MEKPAQFMEEIICPACEQQGHATWESAPVAGKLRHLASLSEGFKLWPPGGGEDPKITCNQCGTTQPEQNSAGV